MSTGVCTAVVDGDTFDLRTGQRIHLANVHAPDLHTWEGFMAKGQLEELVLAKIVQYFVVEESDGGDVADVWVGAVHVNEEMQRFGLVHS